MSLMGIKPLLQVWTTNRHGAAIAGLLAITLLLWLPGGFHMTGLMEEWWHGHMAATSPEAVQAGSAGRPVFVLRPLLLLPWLVSAMIPPNVIVGQNVLLFFLFFGKAAALYGVIVEMLPNGRTLALFSAALYIMLPSSEGLFSLRVLLSHTSAFLFPLSLWLLMRFNRTQGWGWLIGSLIAIALNLLSHESAFLLAFAAPLLLFVQTGWNRSTLKVVGIYLLVPISLLIRYILLWVTLRKGYQAYLVDLGMPNGIAAGLPEMARSIGRAAIDVVFNGWRDAVESIAGNTHLIIPAILIAAVLLAASWRDRSDELPSRKANVLIICAGLLAFILAYMPYLPTPLRMSSVHVFQLSAAGAALSTMSLCSLITQLIRNPALRRAIFVSLACTLISLASAKALDQHQQFIEASNAERRLLADVIEAAPSIKPDTCLVLLNAPLDDQMFLFGSFWADAVGYLNDDFSLMGMFCSPGGVFACAYNPTSGAVERGDGYSMACPLDRVIVFEYMPNVDGGDRVVVLDRLPDAFNPAHSDRYAPRRLIDTTMPDPAVLEAVFGSWSPP